MGHRPHMPVGMAPAMLHLGVTRLGLDMVLLHPVDILEDILVTVQHQVGLCFSRVGVCRDHCHFCNHSLSVSQNLFGFAVYALCRFDFPLQAHILCWTTENATFLG